MTSQGASLTTYNNELLNCLGDLREKRDILDKAIAAEERKKAEIQRKMEKLTAQLARVNESLSQKHAARNEYDVTISETEHAYNKILESSQTLLNVLKRETVSLKKKPLSATTSAHTNTGSGSGAGSTTSGLGSSQELSHSQSGFGSRGMGGSYMTATRTK